MGPDGDLCVLVHRLELHRIADQVLQQLPHTGRIGPHDRHVANPDPVADRLDRRSERVQCLGNKGAEIDIAIHHVGV